MAFSLRGNIEISIRGESIVAYSLDCRSFGGCCK